MSEKVVVLLRGHARPNLLHDALNYYLGLDSPALPVEVSLMLDRPTAEVSDVVALHHDIAQVVDCPFPILSASGQQWMRAFALHRQHALALHPTWFLFADDDFVFEPSFSQELWEVIHNPDVDVWYGRQVFFWEPGLVRTDFFDHNSIVLFRNDPTDSLPTDAERTIMCTSRLHDDAHARRRTGQLQSRALNYGYCGEAARLRSFEAFKRAGKLDRLTLSLLDPHPILESHGTAKSTIG